MPKRAFFTEREFSRLQLFLSFCIIPHATTRSVGRVVMQQIANL